MSSLVSEGQASGTCGELIQGFTKTGQPFHVTLPVELHTTVKLTCEAAQVLRVNFEGPPLSKMETSIQLTAKLTQLEPSLITVTHSSKLSVSKGMGSSTADIIAAARAVAQLSNRILEPEQLADIATAIESSDGSMYPGLVAFDHKSGQIVKRFEWWPQFLICMIVPNEEIVTESIAFKGKLTLGDEFDQLLSDLEQASVTHDTNAFADAATRSAQLNQDYVPNKYFENLVCRFEELGAIGINVAHTGTICGLLFDASSNGVESLADKAKHDLESSLSGDFKIINTYSAPWPL